MCQPDDAILYFNIPLFQAFSVLPVVFLVLRWL